MKRKLAALFCALALLVCALPTALGAQTMYFTAVNDKVLDYSPSTMPVMLGGTIYVPYTVFLSDSNGGVKLDVFGGTVGALSSLVLYGPQKDILTFEMDTGLTYDAMDNYYPDRAIMRNGIIFIPARAVCEYFDLEFSYMSHPEGGLVRIKKPGGYWLKDPNFLSAANDKLKEQKKEYLRAQQPSPTPTPTPPPTPTPAPAPTPVVNGETPPPPVETPELRLAFLCDEGESLEPVLNALENAGVKALFFFPVDALADHDDDIRRLLAQGHKLGFRVDGETAGICMEQARRGNELLRHIARTKTDYLFPAASQRGALEEAGYVCWRETLSQFPDEDTRPATLAANLMLRLESRSGTVHVTLDNSAVTARALPQLLSKLRRGEYTFLSLGESALS